MNRIIILEEKAKELRELVIKMTTKAGTGHVTSSFSCMELLVALYYGQIMQYDSQNPKWEGRDYFIFSKGHANPALYCILADLGFFSRDYLEHFCETDGKLGVLLRSDVPGVEITSGSLGCGLGIAAGIAQALRMDQKPNNIYCMLGDAECREGAIWEAAMHIGYSKLTNIITMIDLNHLGATHFVEQEAGIEPIVDKWEAFGFEVAYINGHNFEEIENTISRYQISKKEKPLVLIAETIKGKGVSFIENKPLMHGAAVRAEELKEAIAEVRKGLAR